ncbi:unnamed protein product [Debaryomyces tyrocola]|nr:unnamed protein product [Debaryomyces tyrocola]
MSNIGYGKKSLDSSNTSTYSIGSSFKSIKSKTSELFKKYAKNDQKECPKQSKTSELFKKYAKNDQKECPKQSKTSELFKKSANNHKERPKQPKINMLVVTEYLALR